MTKHQPIVVHHAVLGGTSTDVGCTCTPERVGWIRDGHHEADSAPVLAEHAEHLSALAESLEVQRDGLRDDVAVLSAYVLQLGGRLCVECGRPSSDGWKCRDCESLERDS